MCDTVQCPGLYRCRGSFVCLHVTHVCDGWSQCPQLDDEKFCEVLCPPACECHGHSYLCSHALSLSSHTQIRFLHASRSGLKPSDLRSNILLIYLNLARCQLTRFGNTTFPNLHTLDVSFNNLKTVDFTSMKHIPRVTSLSLAGNPLTFVFDTGENSTDYTVDTLLELDLSSVEMKKVNPSVFRLFTKLQLLNLSNSKVHELEGEGFQSLPSLRVLDVRGCPFTSISKSIYLGLNSLQKVFADNYKLCCPATFPVDVVVDQCLAPSDEISSCDALLRSDLYRFLLAAFATLATVGNTLSLILRKFVLKAKQKSGYSVFVTHLSVSDSLMGVYLVIIGGADRFYLNSYLWEDTNWRESVTCKVAGFLSLLSSEMSASIICLVTLDRFLVLRFPFSRLRFQHRSALMGCLLLWATGTVLAAVPLLPASWKFYTQTGICIPLPVTRRDFPGDDYAFAVMIIFNFVLFLFIAAGQLAIYMAVRNQSMAYKKDSDKRNQEFTVARRLFIVVVSDFFCWFPIGLLGLLASRDVPISGEVSVGMAVFVLPLNSALNPFLYTLGVIQARRARTREQELLKTLMEGREKYKSTVS